MTSDRQTAAGASGNGGAETPEGADGPGRGADRRDSERGDRRAVERGDGRDSERGDSERGDRGDGERGDRGGDGGGDGGGDRRGQGRLTALITGASAGLGHDYARLFAADGHDVVLVARRRSRLEELAASVEEAHGVRATVLVHDLADPAAPRAIHDAVTGAGIDVEFLVNNAGFGSNGAFADLDLARELEQIQVNIAALVHLTRLFLPGMIARGSGRVLNIGSTAGFQAGPYMATYYATKAFVNHFTEALAHELRGTGVTATVSCPGATQTEFAEIARNHKSKLFRRGAARSEDVARHGYEAMMAGKTMAVYGLGNKLLVQSLRVSPRRLVHKIAAGLNRAAE